MVYLDMICEILTWNFVETKKHTKKTWKCKLFVQKDYTIFQRI